MLRRLNSGKAGRCSRVTSFHLFSAIVGCAVFAGSANSQAGVPPAPLNNPAEAQEFARVNLPPGVRPGDIPTDQPLYPSGNVAGVYRAVLDALYGGRGKRPRLVVLHELAEMRTCFNAACPFIPAHKSRIDTLTLRDFRRATLTRREIRRNFKYRLPLTILTRRGQEALPGIGARLAAGVSRGTGMSEHPFWIGFMSAYPGAWGFAVVTQVGFNPARTQAILQVRHSCGTYCSSTEIMFLRKSKGAWRVAERMRETSDDTDLGHKDLRFRGVGAKRPLAEVRAEFVADSIRKMRVPRAIRGVVTNSVSASPIALARVSIHTGDTPNTPSDYVYSDPKGRYIIKNPPLGSTGIMVHCPKYTRRPGALVGVAGASVETGTDTTVDFPIDMNLCEDPAQSGLSPRPRTLGSPPPPLLNPAEVAAGLSAKYPSPEEAAIYTAVLNGMYGQTPGSVVLVANKTRSFCSGSDCADRYNQRIRSIPEVILSTMENFLSVREKRLSLRPDFTAQSDLVSSYATRTDVALIGDSAMKYLQSEANFSDSAYLASRRGDDLGYWQTIHLAHPSARAMVSFSAVAFSPRRKQAMVEATRADVNGLRVTMFVLNNVEGEWRIVRLF